MRAKFQFSRALFVGERHTVRYRIEIDPRYKDKAGLEKKPYVICFYSDTEPNERELMLVQFALDRIPDKAWWEDVESASRLFSDPPNESNLLRIDQMGCVEYEFVKLRPQRVHAICWNWPET